MSEEHQKSKEQFMEKERETARMEAKRRKLMEKKVREHGLTRFCFYCLIFFNSVKDRSPWLRTEY